MTASAFFLFPVDWCQQHVKQRGTSLSSGQRKASLRADCSLSFDLVKTIYCDRVYSRCLLNGFHWYTSADSYALQQNCKARNKPWIHNEVLQISPYIDLSIAPYFQNDDLQIWKLKVKTFTCERLSAKDKCRGRPGTQCWSMAHQQAMINIMGNTSKSQSGRGSSRWYNDKRDLKYGQIENSQIMNDPRIPRE